MQTVLKSVLAISVCLASLRLVEADWKTDLETYVNSLAADDCKTYLQGDIEKTIKDKIQKTACLSVKTSEPLFQAVTKCSGTVHDNLEKIMCKGVTLSVPATTHWKYRLGSYVIGIQDDSCKEKMIDLIGAQKDQTKETACKLTSIGLSLFTLSTGCSENVFNNLKGIVCTEIPTTTVSVAGHEGKTQPPTSNPEPDSPKTVGWEGQLQMYMANLKEQTCQGKIVQLTKSFENPGRQKTCQLLHGFGKPRFMSMTQCSDAVYRGVERIVCVGGDWEKEIEEYTQGLKDPKCKAFLTPVLQGQKGSSKQKACKMLHGFEIPAFTAASKCSEDVYKRLEKIMCEGGSSLKPVTSSCSGDWEKQIQDYTLGLTDQNCKKSLLRVLQAQKGLLKQKACKSLHQFGMKVFSSTTKCSGDVYKRLEKIMCDGTCSTKDSWKNRFKAGVEKLKDGTCKSKLLQFMHQPKKQDACTVITAARQVFHAATACPRQMYSRVKAWVCGQDASSVPDSTTKSWKIELATFVATVQEATCQSNLMKQLSKTNPKQTRTDACKFIRNIRGVFQTTTKCSKEVYDKMETIICGGGGGTVPKVVATVRGWQTDLNEYVFGLQKSFCRSSLIAQIRMFVERKEEIDPCTYIKKSKPAFAKTTRCSDFVYGRLVDILCIEPPAPKNDTSPRQWKSRFTAYVEKLEAGTCKSSMGAYVSTLTKENQEVHPCKFIKFTKPMIKETTSCPMKVYEDLKEFMCRGSSISLSGYLVVVVCVVRYILLF